MNKSLVLILIFMSIFFSGCIKKNEPLNELSFITWGSTSEISILKPLVEKYNSTHDVKVKLIHVPKNYFQKLHLLFASNLAPDIIFINNLYLPIYQNAGLLEDLTTVIDKKEYFKTAISTLSIEDKLFAIPRDVSSFVVFYNKKMFENQNIVIENDWTINDFYAISRKLKSKNDYAFCIEHEPEYWENFVSIENKPIFQNGKLTIKEKKSEMAIQNLSDAINKYKLAPNNKQLTMTPCAQMFLNEKVSMFISGRWSVPKLTSQAKFEYAIAPFPNGASEFYIPLNASGWAISKKSKNKNEALKFLKFISSDENVEIMTKSGLITPAKSKIAFSSEFNNGEVFIDAIEKSTPNLVPSNYNIEIDKIKTEIKSVLGGYKTVKAALEKL